MSKASKWFKALLGFKKYNDTSSCSSTKNKWSDVQSYRDYEFQQHQHYDKYYLDDKSQNYYGVSMLVNDKIDDRVDPTKDVDVHSNVVTTSSTIRTIAVTTWNGEERAAIVIQSHFRAYLSRRALRALKGVVKLQALVRGHIVRKQTANMLRRMQALIRAQSRALAERSHVFEFPSKSTQFLLHHGPTTPDKFEQILRARSMKNDQMFMLKRNTSNHMDNANAKHRNLFHSSELILNSDQFSFTYDETCYSSVDNSPQLHSTASSKCAHSRAGPFTPTKSIHNTQSYTSDQYSNTHPNYMSYTEAAKAKTRSLSAPKLRPQYEKRYSRSNIQKGSNFHANFTSKGACLGSDRLEKIGMPIYKEFNRDFSHIY